MRRMTIPAIALAISLAPAALSAQTPRMPRAEVRGPAIERIIEQREQLGLSQQQVMELRRIQAQLQEKNQPLLEQLRAARGNVTPEQRAEVRQRRSAALDSLRPRMQHATPEQREQMRARRDSMRVHMQSLTPEQREQMRERMRSLTPEQREQMRERMGSLTPELREQMRERMGSLTPEQREQMREGGRQGARPGMGPGPGPGGAVPAELQPTLEQIRANARAAAEQVHATLTPEQRQKLMELRPARRDNAAERTRGARGPRGR